MSDAVNMRAPIPQERHLEVLTKENPEIASLLAVYPEEESAKLLQNKEKLAKIVKAFGDVSVARSQASMVMTCHAECPYKEICILKREALAPYGHPCPVKKKIICHVIDVRPLDERMKNPFQNLKVTSL